MFGYDSPTNIYNEFYPNTGVRIQWRAAKNLKNWFYLLNTTGSLERELRKLPASTFQSRVTVISLR